MSLSHRKHTRSYAENLIREHYIALKRRYGRLHWWPAASRFEVIVGAILTQNTSWRNVERALTNLRRARKLNLKGIRNADGAELQQLLRPSGYYRQKTRKLKAFVDFLDRNFSGSLRRMFAQQSHPEILELRKRLLEINGIGRETADAILLYAGKFPLFVVDAYARRVLSRHNVVSEDAGYDSIREVVEGSLFNRKMSLSRDKSLGHKPSKMSRTTSSENAQHLNEFHGLLVQVGKQHCFKTDPDCAGCPVRNFLPAPLTAAAKRLKSSSYQLRG